MHQEDFCQALGIPPERKYAAEGGPTFKTSFELLRKAATTPAVEVLKLLDAAIFNLVVGNTDAHGKNFSLLHGQDATTLAPLYDLMCTAVYPELSTKLAMKIADASSLEGVSARIWQKFAEGVGIGLPLLRRRVKDMCGAALVKIDTVAGAFSHAGFDDAFIGTLAKTIGQRTKAVSASTP